TPESDLPVGCVELATTPIRAERDVCRRTHGVKNVRERPEHAIFVKARTFEQPEPLQDLVSRKGLAVNAATAACLYLARSISHPHRSTCQRTSQWCAFPVGA